MNTSYNSPEPMLQLSAEEQERLKALQQVNVQECSVKLSFKEEAIIDEETFRFLAIQKRQEKLNRRRGVPPPPTPGHIAYGVSY